MGNTAAEQYTRVLVIGRELLHLLPPPLSEKTLARVEQLVAERQALAESTTALLKGAVPDPETVGLLQQVLVQQRAVEAAMQTALGSLQKSRVDSQRTMGQMREMKRILNAGPRSGRLNQRT